MFDSEIHYGYLQKSVDSTSLSLSLSHNSLIQCHLALVFVSSKPNILMSSLARLGLVLWDENLTASF